jgi:hypothetical protein
MEAAMEIFIMRVSLEVLENFLTAFRIGNLAGEDAGLFLVLARGPAFKE